MPKRTDIGSILIIGAGPIVIGQACEFDYSGVQACKALRAEGYRIILVNSNPATIMTDPDVADATYVEPITAAMVEQIIAKERPDALLPTMGGQTALNVSLELERLGVLAKYGVEMIGARAEVIDKAEDRLKFRNAMDKIGLESPKSNVAHTLEEALVAQGQVGLPAIIRPSFTLAGTGGGIAYNLEEFREIVERGLDLSPTHEVLIEESVLGWKEFELEVVRDKADNCIIVCSIENIDPMGVHTGDSVTVAPALTLTDKEYQRMRTAAIAVLREVGVETGGSNVQFAVNPADGRMVVIEMNPRVSRSSALASKATGFPIAKVAARLAVGYTLDELMNEITGATVTESPVCTPIGSMFSIEQTITTLSCLSRMSSSSYSFQPSTDSSSSTSVTGLASRPEPAIRSRSAAVRAMPDPVPPRVNDGRTTTGKPSSAAAARASSRVWQMRLSGTSAPTPVTISLNWLRSSPALMASMPAPMSSTLYLARVPLSCSATAAFSAVWPPRVGRIASGRSLAITFASTSGVIGST